MNKNASPDHILKILPNHDQDQRGLIDILEEVQAEHGYLPEEALRTVADKTGRSLVDVYSVATFYRSFSLKPRGKHFLCACLGTACHVRGGPAIVDELEHQLGIKAGETTPDNEFTLETVNCLGACALGPVVVIDGRYFSKVRKSKVRKLLDDALNGLDKADAGQEERIFPIEVSCPRCKASLMDKTVAIDGYPSILVTLSFGEKRGSLRLSSLYGSHHVAGEPDTPSGTVTPFFCPHCDAEIIGSWICPTCAAPMASMLVRGGAMLHICSRRGCKNHMLDLSAPTACGRKDARKAAR